MTKIHKRTLTTEGKAEVGHIFTDGYVPVQEYTPRGAILPGVSEDDTDYQLVFLVDWASLTEAQQFLVLEYVSDTLLKHGCLCEAYTTGSLHKIKS